MLALLLVATAFTCLESGILPLAHSVIGLDSATMAPSRFWGPFFGTSGDVQIDVDKKGLAVRVEIPREFLEGVISVENDTHFIQTDIRNDYYYYSVVDESRHWTYDWNRTASDGACFKPNFSLYDPNAPWCVEVWNYLNGTFLNFTAPRFVRFRGLNAPNIAGKYNFTLFVANHLNKLGYPDFVHAFNKTLVLPISMNDNPATVIGTICDDDDQSNTCPTILTKGVVYARNFNTGQVARAYVNQTTGLFNLTGLAPGNYEIRGSAGKFGGIAFSLSPACPASSCMQVLNLQRGETRSIGALHLHRAPLVCGLIKYRNSLDPVQTNFLAHSLSNHTYLPKVGFKVLNITVEATDSLGHIFRYQNASRNLSNDTFKIIAGSGIKYVGLDPYGTEFAGLPPTDAGAYQLTVNVWISGYLQAFGEAVTITTSPGKAIPVPCNDVSPNPVVMQSGGVISGTLRFQNLVDIETPHQGEASLETASVTDALFGGNILIQAHDHEGLLRGIIVINGTRADHKITYSNSTFVRFYVIGFSEFYNRTWAGTWVQKDYGLQGDSAYTLNVLVRGYEQSSTTAFSLSTGANRSITVNMVRGGAILVAVTSFNNRPGTRALQAEKVFRFLNFSIPIRARVYFYDSSGRTVGYEERLLVQGVNGVKSTSFSVIFAGQNWSLREIWFFGLTPTHITNDTYSIRAYTLGYVQQDEVKTFCDLASLSRVFLGLLLGNEVAVTAPVFAEPELFWHIPEHDHIIGQLSAGGGLIGAVNGNLTAGIPTPTLPIFGFGGMVQNLGFNGQGHFFYVTPDGTRYFDYGLDVGTYSAQIPEFGFNKHFIQFSESTLIGFDDLFQAQGVFLSLVAMSRIVQDNTAAKLVTGWVAGVTVNQTMPLSWVRIDARNQSVDKFVPTLDGQYAGQGALNLPAGIYNITFSVAFYQAQTKGSFAVNWNGTYPLLPPLGPLCPIADPTVCSSSASSAPAQGGWQGPTYLIPATTWPAESEFINLPSIRQTTLTPSLPSRGNVTVA
jgi:hypothetical protein